MMHGSDPEVMYLIGATLVPDVWSKPKVLPTSVMGLLLHPQNYQFSDVPADLIVDLDYDLEMAIDMEINEIELMEVEE